MTSVDTPARAAVRADADPRPPEPGGPCPPAAAAARAAGHAAPVVADQDGAGRRQGSGRLPEVSGGQPPGPRPLSTRTSGTRRPDPGLGDGRPRSGSEQHGDPASRASSVSASSSAPRPVISSTSAPVRAASSAARPGATRTKPPPLQIHHRHRRVRAQTARRAVQVDVEQRVADDDQDPPVLSGTGRGRSAVDDSWTDPERVVEGQAQGVHQRQVDLLHGGRGGRRRRRSRRRRWRPVGWGPVRSDAHTVTPMSRAALAAARTLLLRAAGGEGHQDVAGTAVGQHLPGVQLVRPVVVDDRGAGGGVARAGRSPAYGRRSCRKRPTSSPVRCCASAALPPLPQASSRPPPSSTAASCGPQS